MVDTSDLQHGVVDARTLTTRQEEAARLVTEYLAAAKELPSTGWLSRRMAISRQRAHHYLAVVRERFHLQGG